MNTPTILTATESLTPGVQRFTHASTLITHLTPESTDALLNVLPHQIPGATATRGITSVLVHHAPDIPSTAIEDLLTHISNPPLHTPATTDAPTTHTIPVTYNGEDLTTAAQHLNTTVEELIHAHTHTTWHVHAMGFAPGFAYLAPRPDTPSQWLQWWQSLPRHTTPRTHVPAGSVAVAAGYASIYPSRMPGGWYLLGTTHTTFFDTANPTDPTLLHPGEHVSFTQVTP